MRMNYVPKHFRDRAVSEYVSYAAVDRKAVEFISNNTNTQRHILVHATTDFHADMRRLLLGYMTF